MLKAQSARADDIDVINTELALADLDTVEKAILRAAKAAKGKDQDAVAIKAVAEKILPHLNEAKPLRSFALTDDELAVLKPLSLLTLKPTMYIANVDEEGFENNPYLDAVMAIAEAEGSVVVPICNKLEAEISELEDDEKAEFLEEMGMQEPGSTALFAPATTCSTCRLTLPQAFKKFAPGLFLWAPPRHRVPVRSTPTLKKALSVLKLLATTTISLAMASRAQRMPVNGVSKAKSTSLKTATLFTSALMSRPL